MNKLFKFLSVSCLSLLMGMAMVVPASAEELGDNPIVLGTEISATVSEKIKNNEKLDSEKEEYEDMKPAESVFDKDKGILKETYIYPDGSSKIVTIEGGDYKEISNPIIAPRFSNISGGNRESGTYWWSWTGAVVSVIALGSYQASYKVNMSGSSAGGSISSVWDYNISVNRGTFQNVSLSIIRAEATSGNPARATLYFEKRDGGQSTHRVSVFVPYSGHAYVDYN
ncbi:hypothetical protein [Erysipelothrix anatis]|uniref:hypothetical protein n=1 Tax=Erysipelothrix anatis TaxID=2683713 RepID=UPI00135AF374|nr:hypothetical protein [Erysipelothrix anatis]